jgi:Sec-independent protein translocase protein TatA
MFGISFAELLIILLIIIFCTDPKDLPKIYKNLKDVWRKISEIKNEITAELKTIDESITKEKEEIEYHYLDPKD